jgi:phosphoglycolate phosphatase-like HAD superfamily hydrolase
MAHEDLQAPLKALQPQSEFFVGIDSDGCAFDTMEIKHKECFIPNIIKHWGLQAVSKYARETAEFINLYSKWRGVNRWPALTLLFDMLAERPEVLARHVTIPEVPRLRQWIEEETKLSNTVLKHVVDETGDPELARAYAWSEAVNAAIADMVHDVPPFPYMRESLQKITDRADAIVVSQTPTEALTREWAEHDIAQYVRCIAGQEMGKKSEHIQLATRGHYAPEKMLMIGDAPGDCRAARANDALFYPVMPGHEEESWQRFYEEAVDRFFAGTYAGAYEKELCDEFEDCLPATPPWHHEPDDSYVD